MSLTLCSLRPWRPGSMIPALARRAFGLLAVSPLLLTGALLAQSDIATLEAKLEAATEREKAPILAELVNLYRPSDPQKAIAIGKEALALLQTYPDPLAEVRALNEMVWAYGMLGESGLALELAARSRTLAERSDDQQGLGRALNNEGVIYWRLSDFDRALELWLSALDVRERSDDQDGIAASLNNIGNIYLFRGDLAKALENYQRALEISQQTGNAELLSTHLENIGEVYVAMEDYDRALESYNTALEIATRRNLGENTARILMDIGALRRKQHDISGAIETLRRGLAVAEDVGLLEKMSEGHLEMARAFLEVGQLSRALTEARQALDLARDSGTKIYVRDGYELLSAVHAEMGDHESALSAFVEFKAVHDEINTAEGDRRIIQFETRFEAQQRDREIALLTSQNEVQTLKASRRELQRNAVAGATLFLGILGFLVYRRRVESAKIAEELSVTDSLTGLRNRRFVLHAIEPDLAASRRKQHEGSAAGPPVADADIVFLILDLDHFKWVNDEFGHAAGDQVLIQFAELLSQECRESDMPTRWGGEEFLIVSRFVNRNEEKSLAERIRRRVEENEFVLPSGRVIRRTCSIGFAAYPFLRSEPRAVTWEQIVELADEAMYAAKRAGRNAWVGLSATDTTRPETIGNRTPGEIGTWLASGEMSVASSFPVDQLKFRGEEKRRPHDGTAALSQTVNT